jgi:hypothetical protein
VRACLVACAGGFVCVVWVLSSLGGVRWWWREVVVVVVVVDGPPGG